MHNKLFLTMILVAVVIAIYKVFRPDGLGLGYGIIVLALILAVSILRRTIGRRRSK